MGRTVLTSHVLKKIVSIKFEQRSLNVAQTKVQLLLLWFVDVTLGIHNFKATCSIPHFSKNSAISWLVSSGFSIMTQCPASSFLSSSSGADCFIWLGKSAAAVIKLDVLMSSVGDLRALFSSGIAILD